MMMVMLAHHFLVRMRVQLGLLAPALTVAQVRLLLTSVLPKPLFDAAAALSLCSITSNGIMLPISRIAKPACTSSPFPANFAL